MTRATVLDSALAPIRRDLQATSERLLSQLADPLARRVAYLITAGGKRLRPALVLLTGSSGSKPNRSALIDAAAAIEMIHTATLIHDDIIDGSATRRRQPTFHKRWGTERAVLTGDYLYATAFTLLSRLEDSTPMRIIAEVCQQLSRGELLEVEARFRLDLSEREYLQIIGDKTASLISGCCRIGAYLGGASPQHVEQLSAFGWHFGLAFQIVDDCLDLSGNAKQLGKSIHADLDKGALSLPVIYFTGTLSPRQRQRFFAPLRTHATDPEFLSRVAKAVAETGTLDKARKQAQAFVDKAKASLTKIPLNGLAETYEQLAQYVMTRAQ